MKILALGDDPLISSGYGQVWNNLLKRLCKKRPDWKIYFMSWQSGRRDHKEAELDYVVSENDVGKKLEDLPGIHMLPTEFTTPYGFKAVSGYLKKYNPDFLFTFADIGVQSGFVDAVIDAHKNGWTGKWLAYSPLDTDVWEYLTWDKILSIPDINVTMADFGKEIFTKRNVKNLHFISHGVDLETYRPLENRDELRAKYQIKDKFVVGFVGKNQRRKMIAYLIKGFAQFAKDKEDVKLLLHVDLQPSHPTYPGWSLPEIISRFEAEYDPDLFKKNKIMLTRTNLDSASRQKINPSDMNEIFNVMDVHCYATGGEGFGLPGLECQASGTPLMMTAYSTGFELTHYDKEMQIPVLKDKYDRMVGEIGTNGVENAIPDDKAIAKMLEDYYQLWKSNSEKITENRKKAREFALKYDWNPITDKFIELFENAK